MCVRCDARQFNHLYSIYRGFVCNYCALIALQCLTYLTSGFKQATQIVYDPVHEEFGRGLVLKGKKDPEHIMLVSKKKPECPLFPHFFHLSTVTIKIKAKKCRKKLAKLILKLSYTIFIQSGSVV